MATNNDSSDINDDDNILFDFNTYEEFKKERLKLNYESTLKLWYSLPPGLPNIDNRRVRGYTHRQQRVRMGRAKLFVVYYMLLKRTFLKKKIRSKGSWRAYTLIPSILVILGSRLWNDALNLPSSRDGSLFEIYQTLSRIINEFLHKAERYDSKVHDDELFKAGRLVWYMFAFQLQLNLPLVLSDSMFGYNMLYPYTDDLVDCNDVSREAKKDFARIFYERLLIGESNYNSKSHFDGQQSNVNELQLPPSLQPFADRVGKIFDMVKFIENDWIRNDEHKGVYMSLATIHECQMKSTSLHARPDNSYTPTMAEIEEISAQKGGASVVAAGFIIEGRLTRAKMAYLEYIGFGLQLLDDLQDVKEDMKNNHRTIFTQSIADGQTLDIPTARLIQYFYSTPAFTKFSDDYDTMSNVRNGVTLPHYIHVSMMMFSAVLVFEAASQLRQYYSTEFYRELSTRSPVKFKKRKEVRVEKRIWSVIRHQWF